MHSTNKPGFSVLSCTSFHLHILAICNLMWVWAFIAFNQKSGILASLLCLLHCLQVYLVFPFLCISASICLCTNVMDGLPPPRLVSGMAWWNLGLSDHLELYWQFSTACGSSMEGDAVATQRWFLKFGIWAFLNTGVFFCTSCCCWDTESWI